MCRSVHRYAWWCRYYRMRSSAEARRRPKISWDRWNSLHSSTCSTVMWTCNHTHVRTQPVRRLQRISFFDEKLTKWQKLAVVTKILFFWRNLLNFHFLTNKEWQFWRPIYRNKHSISDSEKMAKFGICVNIFDKVCTFWRTKSGSQKSRYCFGKTL